MSRSRFLFAALGLLLAGQLVSAQTRHVLGLDVKVGQRATMLAPWQKIGVDLNVGAGGEYIYLFKYTGTPSNSEPAVTGLTVLTGQNANAPAGWRKVAVDLNQGAGGDYVWLAYQRSTTGTPIADVRVVAAKSRNAAIGQVPAGWKYVNVDLNRGAGGQYVYLAYQMGTAPATVGGSIAKTTGDTSPLANGQRYVGSLSSTAPAKDGRKYDLHIVTLKGGTNYNIIMRSEAFPPYIRLEDANQQPVRLGGDNIRVTPQKSGTYYILAMSDSSRKFGRYTLDLSPPAERVKAAPPPVMAEDVFPERYTLIKPGNPLLDAVGRQEGSSCVAWATSGVISTVFMNNWYNFQIRNPAKVETFIHKSVNLLDAQWFYDQRGFSGEGWNYGSALSKATQITIPFKSYPEYGLRVVSGPETPLYKYQGTARQVAVGRRYGGYAKTSDRDLVRKEISLDRPVLAAFRPVYTDFQDTFSRSNVYLGPKSGATARKSSSGIIMGHAVMIVGYNKPAPGRAGIKYWDCQNSWGQQWGKKGYFAMGEGVCGIDGEMWLVYNVYMCDKNGNKLSLQKQNEVINKALQNIGVNTAAQPPANGLNPNAAPNFGSVTLKSGFLPDPHVKQLVAGGQLRTNLGGVNTHVAQRPDYHLNYTKGKYSLTIMAESAKDTTLLVRTPGGQWVANDDGGKGLNPLIRFANPESGRYSIYVGTYGTATAPAVLKITER